MTNFKDWYTKNDDVALVLRQKLLPVEGKDAVVFPPTYSGAKESYNIDTLSDGSKVVTIDSEGSQANRMEPLFKKGGPFEALVPQIDVKIDGQVVSLLDAGHRLGDALIRNTPLGTEASAAFTALLKTGDATAIARLAPTSLVFGVWDSRNTGAKVPRIVRSVVRGWDIDRLTRSAQYNPVVNYLEVEGLFEEEDKKKLEDGKSATAQLGYVHVPAVGGHGGVLVRGGIRRDVTVNLVALRRLKATPDETTEFLRKYILALSILAASEEQDGFYRQGCLLVPDGEAEWEVVSRKGRRSSEKIDKDAIIKAATEAKAALGVLGSRTVDFDRGKAKAEVKAKNEEKASRPRAKKAK